VPDAIWDWIPAQRRTPDAEHNRLDDPGPEHQCTADKRDRTEPDRDTTGDKDDTDDHECCRDEPKEPRVFNRCFAF
jgi:hypothetical protein